MSDIESAIMRAPITTDSANNAITGLELEKSKEFTTIPYHTTYIINKTETYGTVRDGYSFVSLCSDAHLLVSHLPDDKSFIDSYNGEAIFVWLEALPLITIVASVLYE